MISWATWVTTQACGGIVTAPVESINAHQRSLGAKDESALEIAIEGVKMWRRLVTFAMQG